MNSFSIAGISSMLRSLYICLLQIHKPILPTDNYPTKWFLAMEIKCPKCRYRFVDDVPSGLNEYSCVCPRCGTPFTVSLNNVEAESFPCKDTASVIAQEEVTPAIVNRKPDYRTSVEQPNPRRKLNIAEGRMEFTSRHRTGSKNDRYLRRLVIAFIVSIVPSVILALFVLSRCIGTQDVPTFTGNTADKILEADTASVYTNTHTNVYSQPVPQWVKGEWTGEAQFFGITLVIGETKITEICGARKARGTYQYDNGRLYCKFPENTTYTYLVNEDTHTITAGKGLILHKQN